MVKVFVLKESRRENMDWNTIGSTFIGGLAGSAIALISTYMANKNQNKIFNIQLDKQQTLFEKQILHNDKIEKEKLSKKRKEVATIFYYLLPEIAWEGFQLNKNAINYPSTIFCNYDFIGALNILGDELEKTEMLYMVKLFANIEAIKTATPNSNEFRNSYVQFLCGFCNGFVNCGNYYYLNIANSKNNDPMPYDKIKDYKTEEITKDFIFATMYSDYFNRSGKDIYSKLKKIKDSLGN
ncbi:MAG: hypothetical protein FH756_13945 [Firmicutes bacterium]|nr:hypothetical protein [Bacillota bacterium]